VGKRIFSFSMFAAALAAPFCAWAQAVTAADTLGTLPMDAFQSASQAVDAARTGQWLVVSTVIVLFLTRALKTPAFGAIMARMPKRARILVPVVLGGVAAVLSSLSSGAPWLESVLVGASGPLAVFAHEFLFESVIAKPAPAVVVPPVAPPSDVAGPNGAG